MYFSSFIIIIIVFSFIYTNNVNWTHRYEMRIEKLKGKERKEKSVFFSKWLKEKGKNRKTIWYVFIVTMPNNCAWVCACVCVCVRKVHNEWLAQLRNEGAKCYIRKSTIKQTSLNKLSPAMWTNQNKERKGKKSTKTHTHSRRNIPLFHNDFSAWYVFQHKLLRSKLHGRS